MASDYVRMHRIAGFVHEEKLNVSEVKKRISDRIDMIEAAEKPEAQPEEKPEAKP